MAVINFSQADVLRSKTLEKGWYSFELDIKPPKADKSGLGINYEVVFRLIDHKVAELNGKEINRFFSSKAISLFIPLIAASEGKPLEDYKEAFAFDYEALVGKKLDGKVEIDIYEGNSKNDVKEFAPYKTAVGQALAF